MNTGKAAADSRAAASAAMRVRRVSPPQLFEVDSKQGPAESLEEQ
jgi:hypothetical protein